MVIIIIFTITMLSNGTQIIFGVVFVLFLFPTLTNFVLSENELEEILDLAYYNEENFNYDEAMKYFDQVLELDPNNIQALNGKGVVFLKLNNHEQSNFYFDRALEIDPNYTQALNNKGILLGILGNSDEAEKNFDRVLEIDPENVKALVNKATLKVDMQDLEGAIELLNKALKIDPDNQDAINNKNKVFVGFENIPVDGFTQTIYRDKDGNLIGYFESDRITMINYTATDEIIHSWADATQTVLLDDQEYERIFISIHHDVDPDVRLLTGFFNYHLNPYRLVPLIVFFATGFGLLFKRTHLGRIR